MQVTAFTQKCRDRERNKKIENWICIDGHCEIPGYKRCKSRARLTRHFDANDVISSINWKLCFFNYELIPGVRGKKELMGTSRLLHISSLIEMSGIFQPCLTNALVVQLLVVNLKESWIISLNLALYNYPFNRQTSHRNTCVQSFLSFSVHDCPSCKMFQCPIYGKHI